MLTRYLLLIGSVVVIAIMIIGVEMFNRPIIFQPAASAAESSSQNITIREEDFRDLNPQFFEKLHSIKPNKDNLDALFDLAQWCQENDLLVEKERTLKLILTIDPGNDQALAILNRDRRQRAREERQLQRNIASLAIQTLSDDPDISRNAENKLYNLETEKEKAATIHLLNSNKVELRKLGLNLVNYYKLNDASLTLAQIALHDDADQLRNIAQAAIPKIHNSTSVDYLCSQLRSAPAETVRTIANLLGNIGDVYTVPYLVRALTPLEPRNVSQFSYGTSAAYVAGFRAKVDKGAVAYEPIIRFFPRRRKTRRDYEMERRIYETYQANVAVKAALEKITGEDYGYDRREWLGWYHRYILEQKRKEEENE